MLKNLTTRIFVTVIGLFAVSSLFAQSTIIQPNIAVIPFVGDKNVTTEQLNFLTGKFAGELIQTKVFRVLDRGKMDFVLKEQGFTQSGLCSSSECQVQIGQLLGVDVIVAGNLVRFGKKYAFRADYIDVTSGQVLFTAEYSESGDLEDIYERLCQVAAKDLAQKYRSGKTAEPKIEEVDTQAPVVTEVDNKIQNPITITKEEEKPLSFKRKVALFLWSSTLIGAGAGYYYDQKGAEQLNEYAKATEAEEIRNLAKDIDNSENLRNGSYGVSMGTALVGLLLWVLPEGGN